MTTLATERLVLRPWTEADRAAFLALNLDPRVGAWLGGPFTEAAVAQMFERALADVPGQWLWAACAADRTVVGMMMLRRIGGEHPMAGQVEIGWRLSPAAWGRGYASEAARAVLDFGFAALDADEIIAFTAASNRRSQAVMARIGLARDPARDFDHPALAADHPLRPHVVYAGRRPG